MCTPEYSVRVPEYQESIFEKVIEPLQRWQNAQINLFILDRKNLRPTNYEIQKKLFETQMLAEEIEMKKILDIK